MGFGILLCKRNPLWYFGVVFAAYVTLTCLSCHHMFSLGGYSGSTKVMWDPGNSHQKVLRASRWRVAKCRNKNDSFCSSIPSQTLISSRGFSTKTWNNLATHIYLSPVTSQLEHCMNAGKAWAKEEFDLIILLIWKKMFFIPLTKYFLIILYHNLDKFVLQKSKNAFIHKIFGTQNILIM